MDKLNKMLNDWKDTPRTMSQAEELIEELQIMLAGKLTVIKELNKDIEYYKGAVNETNRRTNKRMV